VIFFEAAHHTRRRAFKNFDDATLRLPETALSLDVDQHPIAVKRITQCCPGDINVRLGLFRLSSGRAVRAHETEAPRLARKPSCHQIHFLGKTDSLGARSRQLSLGQHFTENTLGGESNVSLDAEHLEEVFFGGGTPEPG
jgi:hypothetical protein